MKVKIVISFLSIITVSSLVAQKATEVTMRYTLDSAQISETNLYMEAVRLKSLGNSIEALNLFDQVTSIDPRNAAAYYEAANLEMEIQNVHSATTKAQKAYELDKSNKYYSEFYLSLLTKSGKIDEAIDVMDEVIKSGKADDIAKMQYAYLLSLKGNSKKALQILSQFEKNGEVNEAVSYEKIKIYVAQKDYTSAEAEFKKMIQANPGDMRFLGNLAEFYLKISKMDEAEKAFNDMLLIEPNNVNALLYKVQYYQLKKDIPNYRKTIDLLIANKDLNLDTKISLIADKFSNSSKLDSIEKKHLISVGERLVSQYPEEVRSYQVLADMYYINGDYDKARTNYKKALAINNAEYAVWQNLFYSLNALRSYSELADSTASALDLFPANAIVYFYNGIANSQINKNEQAEKSYKRGLKFVGDNKSLEAQMYSSLGETYQKLKRYDESDKNFEMAIKLDPDNAYTLNNFAYYLSLRKDKLDYARVMSKKSLDIEKENSSFLDTYAWICFQLEKYEDAKFYQEKALAFGKEDMSTIYEHYGDILIKLNDVDNALKYWNKAKENGSKNKSLPTKISTRKYVDYQD